MMFMYPVLLVCHADYLRDDFTNAELVAFYPDIQEARDHASELGITEDGVHYVGGGTGDYARIQ